MSAEKTLREKLASNMFTHAERGALKLAFAQVAEAAGREALTKTAASLSPEQQEMAKLAEVVNSVQILPDVFNQALPLNGAAHYEAIEKCASTMTQAEFDAIYEKCRHDVSEYQGQQQQLFKVGHQLGIAMWHGFNDMSDAYNKQAEEQKADQGLAEQAPAIAEALKNL